MKPINAYYRTYQFVFKLGANFMDWSKPEILSGAGAVKQLPALIQSKGFKNILVVTDGGITKIGLAKPLYDALDAQGISYVIYDGTQPNPTFDNIHAARDMYKKHNCEAIIAFGGGSPMDCAKACAALIACPKKTLPQLRGLLKVGHKSKMPTLFAVPTTAGTGSETTVAAVVTNPQTHEKYAINDMVLRPKYAVLDPELTYGLPKHITSTTGIDALTHAVEAYLNNANTKETLDCAEKAVDLIFKNLKTAYDDGKNTEARSNMLMASHLAGIAFTRAYVGYVHAIAHNMGGLYGVPHGLANAVILPYVLEYYGETAAKGLAKLADFAGLDCKGLTQNQKAAKFIKAIRELNESMDIPEKLDAKEKDIPTLVERALLEANPTYPVPKIMDKKDCESVIRRFANIVE